MNPADNQISINGISVMGYHNSEAATPNLIPSTEDFTSLSNTSSVHGNHKDTKDDGDLLATYTDTFHELPTSSSTRTNVFDSLPDNFDHKLRLQASIDMLTAHQCDPSSALGAIKNFTVALSTNGSTHTVLKHIRFTPRPSSIRLQGTILIGQRHHWSIFFFSRRSSLPG